MKQILVIHQSSEMYGSDRSLLIAVKGMIGGLLKPIVILPREGPLYDALKASGIEVHILPLALLGRYLMNIRKLSYFFLTLIRSIVALSRFCRGRGIDIVYSNTLAVISGAIWARLASKKHVWHVRDVAPANRFQKRILRGMLITLSDVVICNSNATRDAWINENGKAGRTVIKVIHNGVSDPPPVGAAERTELRTSLNMMSGDLLVTCVGRINHWKGQEVLVRAAERLWKRGWRNLHFLFVGSPPAGQEHYLTNLEEMIAKSEAASILHVVGFRENIWPVWAATDIAVLPSVEPEPFGLVVIEAMAMSCPVIATAHGGPLEIIDDGCSGSLVKAGDVEELADGIEKLARDAVMRQEMGAAGRSRFLKSFSAEQCTSNLIQLLNENTQ